MAGEKDEGRRVVVDVSVRLAVAGVVAGIASAIAALVFGAAVDALAGLFQAHAMLVWLLPIAGLLTFALYNALRVPFSTSTRVVLAGVGAGGHAQLPIAPAIFGGTCLSIAAGGSVGKEAAALQMSAALAPGVGRLFGLKTGHALRVLALCGMAASFGVLLGTPFAAAVFVFELFRPRREHLYTMGVVLAASLLSALVASALALDYLDFQIAVPALSFAVAGRVALLVVVGSLVAVAFCWLLERGRAFTQHHLHPAAWLVIGGLAYAGVVSATGWTEVAGTGMAQNVAALSGDLTSPFFVLKLALTILLLVCGFKGGEIMPTLCIGMTLGSFLGNLTGGDAAFLAALGMVLLFAACTDCPLTAVLIGVETCGVAGLPWYLAVAALGYALTSRASLYSNSGGVREWPLLRYARSGRSS